MTSAETPTGAWPPSTSNRSADAGACLRPDRPKGGREGCRASIRAAILTVVLLVASLIVSAWPVAAAERRVALVVGNSAYKSVVALSNPRNDAEDVASTLRDLGFEVMLRTDVQKNDLRTVLKDFSRLSAGADTALVYYAGHALQYQGRYFLMPVDAALEDEDAVKFDMLPTDDLRDVVGRVNGVRILIFDACRNDPFVERPAPGGPSAPLGTTRGLTRVKKAQGTVTVFATAPFDVAEDGKDRHSPFTRALLKRLKEPGLEIGRLFRMVTRDVNEATGGRQTPEVTISMLDDYYINRAESEEMFWVRIRSSGQAADLRDFVSRFPASPFADAARFRLAALEVAERAVAEENRRTEQIRRDEEQRRRREIEARQCAAEAAAIEAALATGRRDAIDAVGQSAKCSETAANVTRARATLATREAEEKARREAEEAARREAAAAQLRQATCRAEADRIAAAGAAGERPAGAIACPENKAAFDAVVAAIAERTAAAKAEAERKARAEACRKEAEAIAGADLAGQRPAGPANCRENQPAFDAALAKASAREAVAKSEADRRALEENCRKEVERIRSLATAGRRDDLVALRGKGVCRETAAAIETGLAEIDRAEAEAKQRRDAEQAARRLEAACREEAVAVTAAARDRARLQAIAAAPRCPASVDLARDALAAIDAAEQQICSAERARLAAVAAADAKALQGFAASAKCPAVAAEARTAAEVADRAKATGEAICATERAEIEKLKAQGDDGRKRLATLRGELRCPSLAPIVVAALEVPATALGADRFQTALKRLGCFDGRIDVDNVGETRAAATRYLKQRGEKAEPSKINLDQVLLARLEAEPGARVCPLVCANGQTEQGGRCVERLKPRPEKAKPERERPVARSEPEPRRSPPEPSNTAPKPTEAPRSSPKPTPMLGL